MVASKTMGNDKGHTTPAHLVAAVPRQVVFGSGDHGEQPESASEAPARESVPNCLTEKIDKCVVMRKFDGTILSIWL